MCNVWWIYDDERGVEIMEFSLGAILTFLIVLFSINGVCLMLGVIGEQPENQISPFVNSDGNVIGLSQVGEEYTVAYGPDYGTDDLASTDATYLPSTPYGGDVMSNLDLFWFYLKNLTFGYYFILMNLGLPFLMVMLITGIIAFIQLAAIFFLISWIVTIFRGGSIAG